MIADKYSEIRSKQDQLIGLFEAELLIKKKSEQLEEEIEKLREDLKC